MSAEWLNILRLRLRAWFHRRQLDRDLEEELAFHFASDPLADDAAARRRFGNPTFVKEICRDMWTFRWIEALLKDAAYAGRTLRKNPGFAAVAVLTLAFGIGANTAIFSVADALILRSLPYPDANRLFELWGNVKRTKVERRGTSIPDYFDWKQQSHSFEGMALFTDDNVALTGIDEPELIPGEFVDHDYFRLLGIRPQIGRVFHADEDEVPQRNAVAVISDGLWKRRFGGDPGVLGRTVQLNGRPFIIIGVMPAAFRGAHDSADIWAPLMMGLSKDDLTADARGNRGPAVLGRLKPGVSLAQAQSEMDAICKRLESAYPKTNEARGVEISPLETEIFGEIRKPLTILLAAVLLVLLIACTNVANLLLARSEARQREIAMRIALGAGRGRITRQLLTESLVMTLLAVAAGLVIARWGVRALIDASPVQFPGYVNPSMNWSVALFTAAISFAAAMAMGLAPAAQVRLSTLAAVFKQTSSHAVGSPGAGRFRNALVVAEIALAMLLLVGAGLLIRSLGHLTAIRPGYDPTQVLTLRAALPQLTPTTSDSGVTGREILRRLAGLPSVRAAALSSDLPFSEQAAMFYSAEGQPPVTAQNRPRAYSHRVTPGFFSAMQIPLLAGRTFSDQEMLPDSNVVIVTQNVAKRFWPGEDPIGKRIKPGSASSSNPWMTIVGVVNELKYRGLPDNPTPDPDMFFPLLQRQRQFAVLLRTPLPPASLAPAVRKTLHESDPGIIVYEVATMRSFLARETATSRFAGWLLAIFAASALLLAVVGIYGVMSYAVARRRQEIGVRVALGAPRSDVLQMVIRHGMALTVTGLAIGVAAAILLTRLMSSLLYGISPWDAASFAAAAAAMISVALVACLIPAARAARIDPMAALRSE